MLVRGIKVALKQTKCTTQTILMWCNMENRFQSFIQSVYMYMMYIMSYLRFIGQKGDVDLSQGLHRFGGAGFGQ